MHEGDVRMTSTLPAPALGRLLKGFLMVLARLGSSWWRPAAEAFPPTPEEEDSCLEASKWRKTTRESGPSTIRLMTSGTSLPRTPRWWMLSVTTAMALANDTRQMDTP